MDGRPGQSQNQRDVRVGAVRWSGSWSDPDAQYEGRIGCLKS